MMAILSSFVLSCWSGFAAWPGQAMTSPYPPSPVIAGITWHWPTRRTAAPGSDLWPVTWGADDHAATWKRSPWVFPKGQGRFKPATFLNVGKGYTGVPAHLQGHVYFYGQRQGQGTQTYLGRVRSSGVQDRQAYEFLAGFAQG